VSKISRRVVLKYKSFLRLRENVLGNKKIFKFQKKKWVRLKKRLRSFVRWIKVKNYNHRVSKLSRYAKRLKNTYRTALFNKQRLNFFYGKLKERQLKKVIRRTRSSKKIRSSSLFLKKEDLFIGYLESLLENVLLRSGFFISAKEISQILVKGHVLVNSRQVVNGRVILQEGDVISFSPKLRFIINTRLKRWRGQRFLKVCPPYLEINFKTLRIVLVEKIRLVRLQQFFPFWLDLKTIFYRYS